MKNKHILFGLFLFFTILASVPSTQAAGDDINYSISRYSIKATLNNQGLMHVTETLNYHFDDTANGIYRDIDFQNPDNPVSSGSSIQNIKVYELFPSGQTEKEFHLSQTALSNGVNGLYTKSITDKGVKLKIYSPARYTNKYFKIQYDIPDTVVQYNDTDDFFWQFIGTGWETSLNHVSIQVSLPKEVKGLRFFSHGSLSGHNTFIDDHTVLYTVSSLSEGSSVSLRLLFQPGSITSLSAYKHQQFNHLAELLRYEEALAKKSNTRRRNLPGSVTLAVLWPAFSIVLYILLARKYGRRVLPDPKGCTEPPFGFSPAFCEYASGYHTVSPNGITAELMNLVRKRYLLMDETARVDSKGKEKADYLFTKQTEASETDYPYEAFLIHWFLNEIGDGNCVSLYQIQQYSRKQSSQFAKEFEKFKSLLKKQTEELNYKTERTPAPWFGFLFFLFSTISGIMLAVLFYMYEFGISSCLSSLVVFLLCFAIRKPTEEFTVFKKRWVSYRKHLKKLSLSNVPHEDHYDLPYWEQTLVFMILFNHHKGGIKRLQTEYPSEAFSDPELTYLHSSGGGFHGLTSFSEGINSSVSSFTSTTGFSSGGGSGAGAAGGGGGGGGAF